MTFVASSVLPQFKNFVFGRHILDNKQTDIIICASLGAPLNSIEKFRNQSEDYATAPFEPVDVLQRCNGLYSNYRLFDLFHNFQAEKISTNKF